MDLDEEPDIEVCFLEPDEGPEEFEFEEPDEEPDEESDEEPKEPCLLFSTFGLEILF